MPQHPSPRTTNTPRESRCWRLVVPHGLWEVALRGLLDAPQRCAIGNWRWRTLPQWQEALVEGIQIAASPATGAERSAGDQWFCLQLLPELSAERFAALVRECQPQRGQLLIVATINSQGTAWGASLVHRDEVHPIVEIRVNGPRPLRLSRSAASGPNDDSGEFDPTDDEARWSRTTGAIGEEAMRWLRQATITQVGAGRLGTILAHQWAALGVRRLRLCDPDVLQAHNLGEVWGLGDEDIGRAKVAALGESLRRFRPDLELSLLARSAQDRESVDFLGSRSDLLVTAVDDELPRLLVSRLARASLTPHLDLASFIPPAGHPDSPDLLADARLLLPGMGCVECVGGFENREEVLERLEYPDAIPRRRPPTWREQRAGSLVTLNQSIAGLAGQMVIDLVRGDLRMSFWQRLRWRRGGGLTSVAGPVGRGTDCPLCFGRQLTTADGYFSPGKKL